MSAEHSIDWIVGAVSQSRLFPLIEPRTRYTSRQAKHQAIYFAAPRSTCGLHLIARWQILVGRSERSERSERNFGGPNPPRNSTPLPVCMQRLSARVREHEQHPPTLFLSNSHAYLGGEIVTAGAVSYPFPGVRSATLKTLPDRLSVVVALAVSVKNGGASIFAAGGRPAS